MVCNHILELTFQQQIFMIFIVEYFYQNGFLKIAKKYFKIYQICKIRGEFLDTIH